MIYNKSVLILSEVSCNDIHYDLHLYRICSVCISVGFFVLISTFVVYLTPKLSLLNSIGII